MKDSRWFIPLERQGLQNLLNERKIIRAAQKTARLPLITESRCNL
nr:CsgG/HfaB family protein [Escherichia coli]